jgi:biopolymer transport protein TolQ
MNIVIAMEASMWELVSKAVTSASPLEQGVLYLLIIFSIVSWAVIFMKIKAVTRAKNNNDEFLKVFDEASTIQAVKASEASIAGIAPLNAIFIAGRESTLKNKNLALAHSEDYLDKTHQAMAHTAKAEFNAIRWGLGFLASVASASPFIGLFGTVWGIMATFQTLGDAKTASLNVVAPGISAALIATAMGLAVAIPAVMAYNAMLAKIDDLQEKGDMFIDRMTLMVRSERNLAAANSQSTTTSTSGTTVAHKPQPEVAGKGV